MTEMTARSGTFAASPLLPPPVIFDLGVRFRADAHPTKLNLGIGVYRDEALQPAVFSAVRKAEALVVAATATPVMREIDFIFILRLLLLPCFLFQLVN